MKPLIGLAVAAAFALAACGGSGTTAVAEPASPEGAAAGAELTQGGDQAAADGNDETGGAALIAGDWRCKAQGDIPIGILKVKASGAYEFVVVKNSLWDPKPGDSGNGKGKLGAPEGLMKPLSGPLVDTYEILDIARAESEWGVRIYLNNDYGSLMHCGLASEEG